MDNETQMDFENINIQKNVNDFACLIEEGREAEIDKVIDEIEKKTQMEVAIVTINSLRGKMIDELAFSLFNKFGIGKKDENNGILLLIAKDENQYRLEIGLGLEKILDKSTVKKITENIIVPDFRKGIYAAAILKLVKTIAKKAGMAEFSKNANISLGAGIISIFLTIAAIFIAMGTAFKNIPDIKTLSLPVFYILISIPAIAASVIAIICGITDIMIIAAKDITTRKTTRSITGIILAIISMISFAFILFYLQPVLDFLARLFSLSSGSY